MMGSSLGTGELRLKLAANIFSSINLTSLLAVVPLLRILLVWTLCWAAKDLKALATSVAVTFAVPPGLT